MDSFSHSHFFLLEYQAIFCEIHETHKQNNVHIQSYHLERPHITEALQIRALLVMTNAYCKIFLSYIAMFSFFTPLFFSFFFFSFTDLNGPEAVCNCPKAGTRMYMGTIAPKPYCLQ